LNTAAAYPIVRCHPPLPSYVAFLRGTNSAHTP
jgi:hypothetical protein